MVAFHTRGFGKYENIRNPAIFDRSHFGQAPSNGSDLRSGKSGDFAEVGRSSFGKGGKRFAALRASAAVP
jgi:hypothetical protein